MLLTTFDYYRMTRERKKIIKNSIFISCTIRADQMKNLYHELITHAQWWKERTRDGWNLRVLYILWITFFDWFPMQTKFFFHFHLLRLSIFFCRCLILQKQPIWFFTLFLKGCSQDESNYISSFCVLNYFSFNYIMFHVISAVSSHFFLHLLCYATLNWISNS